MVEYLLIGGGIAGATAARTLRERGATGAAMLLSRERDLPYHRPPITKGYLQRRQSRADALIEPEEFWKESQIDVRLGTSVTALDTQARTATLSTRETVGYGRALLATGSMVRRLNVDGAQLDGIHYLRALGNADALLDDIAQRRRVVLVGGSYIACEVAASLTTLGLGCTMVMQESLPLERSFGAQAGRFFRTVLEQHGVELVADDEVERFEGSERVERVLTRSGRAIDADVVVAGVGAIPDVMLARKAGLELGPLGGVLASGRLESSAPGVFVAGDMCEYDSVVHGCTMRIEHEDVAARQGETAARNMLGDDVAHDAVPYFFSDLADWVSLEYVGPARTWQQEVVRGSIEAGRFSIFYLNEGRLAAALAVGRPDDLDDARRLIAAGTQVEAGELG